MRYLEDARGRKAHFVDELVGSLGSRVTKEELAEKLKANCFQSYRLRMAVAGIPWLT